MTAEEAAKTFGCEDLHTLDYQLDHLRELGLLTDRGGFDGNTGEIRLEPTSFAVSFYVRCQGFVGAPSEYFPSLPQRPLPSTEIIF